MFENSNFVKSLSINLLYEENIIFTLSIHKAPVMLKVVALRELQSRFKHTSLHELQLTSEQKIN